MNGPASQTPNTTAVTHFHGKPDASVESVRAANAAALRVLLVEDCLDQQIEACRLLCRWGIQPAVATNGVRAVKLCREHLFDVVLMDIAMPIMDGLEATRLIRHDELALAMPRRCPIIAYTSERSLDDRLLWIKIGIDDVLIKPTQPVHMAAVLSRWCGGISLHP